MPKAVYRVAIWNFSNSQRQYIRCLLSVFVLEIAPRYVLSNNKLCRFKNKFVLTHSTYAQVQLLNAQDKPSGTDKFCFDDLKYWDDFHYLQFLNIPHIFYRIYRYKPINTHNSGIFLLLFLFYILVAPLKNCPLYCSLSTS